MSVSARYPPLRSRGRARSADSQRGRFGGRGVGERRMVADGGAPDCGTPAAGNARADSRRYFCAPSANQNIPRKVEKSRSVPPPQQSGHARVSHPRCRRCWLSRALQRVASRPTIDATPHPRCDACHPTLPTWSVHPRAPDHPSDENQKAPRAKPNDALGPSI